MVPVHPDNDVATPVITSAAEFGVSVAWCVRQALAHQSRRLLWIDPDFADWPLSEPALLGDLQRWLTLPQRQLLMLALDFQALHRCHARFVGWRRDRTHQVELLSPAAEDVTELPTLAIDDSRTTVQLLDRQHWRGRCALDARQARRLNQQFDALLQRSGPGLATTTLGL